MLVFQIVEGLCGIPFRTCLEFRSTGHFTRGHGFKLKKDFGAREGVLRSFHFRVIPLWNALPVEIMEASSLEAFKSRLRKLLSNS